MVPGDGMSCYRRDRIISTPRNYITLWKGAKFNPKSVRLGAYMTSETLNRYNSAMAKVMNNFKIDVFLKKHLVSISC